MLDVELNKLTEKIIGCAFTVSNCLGSGFLEKVYENALTHEIEKCGMKVQQPFPIRVHYDSIVVGEYTADLLVEDKVLVELKAVKLLDDVMTVQCMNYLRATNYPVCLWLNFGRPRLEIRRIIPNDSWRQRKPQALPV